MKTDSGDQIFTADANTQMLADQSSSPTTCNAGSVTKDMKIAVIPNQSDPGKAQMALLNYSN